MRLIGQALSAAGIEFISCKATHSRDGKSWINDLVVVDETQRSAAQAWADREGCPVEVRIATPEELADWKRWQENF